MTTETREEIDLMVDKVADLTSTLNDYEVEEEDADDDEATPSEQKLTRFNIKQLKAAQHHLDRAKEALQGIVTLNN